jgi:hypothetical protein
MHAPVLGTSVPPISPAQNGSAPRQTPPRVWKQLSASARTQIACVVADMAKRMAATASARERGDDGDHDDA